MDNMLFSISLFFNLLLLVAFFLLLYLLIKRREQTAEIEENLANQVNGLQLELEGMRTSLDEAREACKAAEVELTELRKQSQEKLTVCEEARALLEVSCAEEAAKLEPLTARLNDALLNAAKFEREAARLRGDAAQAMKRMEAAEVVAGDSLARFQRAEASLEAKEGLLNEKRNAVADLESQLREEQSRMRELLAERDRLAALETALGKRLEAAEEARRGAEREVQRLNDELAEAMLNLREASSELAVLRESAEARAVAGGELEKRCHVLEEQVAHLSGALARKEAALVDLEAAHASANAETPYAAHRHMQWTLNHFDPQSITFKFMNEGAEVFLVAVETDHPDLTYELETGHGLPRETEARIKVLIKKDARNRLAKMPEEFEMTVLYALHVLPIRFKIRPREGQRIERISS
jgi:chromosome segregation ATPase